MNDADIAAALQRLNANMTALADSRTKLARGLDHALDTMTRRLGELDQELAMFTTRRRLDTARAAARARMLKRSRTA